LRVRRRRGTRDEALIQGACAHGTSAAATDRDGEAGTVKTLQRILPYYKNYRWLMIASYIAVVANAFFNLVVPQLIGRAVDQGVSQQDISLLVVLSVGIVVASGLRGLAAFAQN